MKGGFACLIMPYLARAFDARLTLAVLCSLAFTACRLRKPLKVRRRLKFPTYPERAYSEVAALTISIWYPDDAMVELEPIGPSERLDRRGAKASFTETWFLLEHRYPKRSEVSGKSVQEIVSHLE